MMPVNNLQKIYPLNDDLPADLIKAVKWKGSEVPLGLSDLR